MKAIFKSIFMLAVTLSFAACSDVPSPYDIPNNNGGTTPTTTDYINETFATSLGVFTAKTVKGTPWAIDYSTAKATGYDSKAKTTTASDGYLVSTPVDLSKSTAANITFSYILRYYTKSGAVVPGVKNQVLITDNYTGAPSTTTWTDITGTLTEGADWTTFSTYKANVPSTFIGKSNIVVALHYACETSSSTWEVKNFVMKEGSVDETPTTPTTPTGTGEGAGTQASPYNVTKALSLKTYTSDKVYVSGTISKIDEVNTSYGNATYYISDDGATTTQLEVFHGYGLGGAKFTSASDIKVGDKVIVYGALTLYNNTPEITAGSQIYSLNGTTSGGGKTGGTGTTSGISISGTTVTLTNSAATEGTEKITADMSTFGYANGDAVTKVTLTDGTTITFDSNGETNGPKYYDATKGVRVYKNNTMTFNGKAVIAKVVITCDTYNGTNYVGNTTATLAANGKELKYTNVFTESSGGGVQLRVKTIEITYAK
jgi:hypothetical protein